MSMLNFRPPPNLTHFIFIANKCSSLHFPVMISVYLRWNFSAGRRNFCLLRRGGVSAVQGHPRSIYLHGANRKRLCNFLLVRRNSNFGHILHHFGATARFMCSWPHPYSSTLILGVFPLNQIAHVDVSQSRGLKKIKLFGREVIFDEFQPMWSRYLIVTDGQTNRQTDGQTKAIS